MSYMVVKEVELPEFYSCDSEPIIESVVSSLGISRNVLASKDDIETVWTSLRPTLEKINLEYRHEVLARMVVSIRMGLFSAAVNDMWNTAILALRQKVRNFGFTEASSFLEREISDKKLVELRDKDLIDICVKLGFLDDTAYFFINNCREIRNNYSSAHPSAAMLDGMELNYFMHQCTKHILGNDTVYEGFPVAEFMKILKAEELNELTKETFIEKIKKANELQQSAILKMLFSNYVDDVSDEFVRNNCLEILGQTWGVYNQSAVAEIIELYASYSIKGATLKKQYSERLFEKLGKVELLPKEQRIGILLTAIKDLENAHHGMNNFYNENPFAIRLSEINHRSVPKPVIYRYVYVVALGYVGNSYGTASSAEHYYEKMIKNFSLKDVEVLFEILEDKSQDNYLVYRVGNVQRCKIKFKELLKLLNDDVIPVKNKSAYTHYLK